MHVDVYMTYDRATERRLRERSVVVIDVLRATTTMIEIMSCGANNIFPVCEVEDAMKLFRARGESTSVLAGERNATQIGGFSLGNSPQDFTPAVVQGKTVIFTTTNGTSALNFVRNSEPVLLGALRNRMAVVRKLIELGNDISLVCAGTDGSFSADDFYCAGAIIKGLIDHDDSLQLEDIGKLALLFYKTAKEDPTLVQESKHYQKLLHLGYTLDLAYCFEEDACSFVPKMVNGIIEL